MVLNRQKNSTSLKRRLIVTYSYPESFISEQYRMIQTNIKFSLGENRNNILVVTSPNDGDGKTVAAANLAVSMAQQNEKVLILDANYRNPSLQAIFKLPNSRGLTDVLLGLASMDEAVSHTAIASLDVLTIGQVPLNYVELLGSKMMAELLKNAQEQYNTIIIDSPSLLEVSDTKILANQSDGVILVLNKGKTKIEKAKESKKVLEFSKTKVIGVILND